MPIRIKPIETLKAKYARNAGAATGSYEEGVNFPRRSQSEAAAASAPTWELAVQNAIADGRFAAGVREAGDEKWKRGAIAKRVRMAWSSTKVSNTRSPGRSKRASRKRGGMRSCHEPFRSTSFTTAR